MPRPTELRHASATADAVVTVADKCPMGVGAGRRSGFWNGRARISLARASLFLEWKRYLAAALAVAFSGVLVLVQLALLLGMFGTVSTIIERARADLWIVEGRTESFDLARPMPARYEMLLRTHPAVETVQTLLYEIGDWRRPDGGKVTVYIVGLDVSKQSLSLPNTLDDGLRDALRLTRTVVVDQADAAKLGVAVGDLAEINGQRVTVVGFSKGMQAIGGANVFVSMTTAKLISPLGYSSEQRPYFLVKLRDPSSLEKVQAELQLPGDRPAYRVLTPAQLSRMSEVYWLLESGAGAGFGFSSLLAIVVGIAITSATLRGAILSSLREYATLRALGVSVAALRAVVLEQSFWVGVAGLILTGFLTAVIALIAGQMSIPFEVPWWTLGLTTVFIVTVALGSGFLALRPLYRTEPADLLR
jgi:putative ABC transport system permease protein